VSEAIWTPSAERAQRARLTKFIGLAAQRTGRQFADYAALHRWSVQYREEFWPLLAAFTGVEFRRPPERILMDGDRMPGARWFVGAELNFAEHLLRRVDDRPAIVFRGEDGRREEVSFATLRSQVGALAAALRAEGVGPGDRVAGFLPNHPSAVIAMLAASSIGAVWSSCSPDFGAAGVVDRFGQIGPKLLFTADGYRYGSKVLDSRPVAAEVARKCPSVRRVVVVPFLEPRAEISAIPHAVHWSDLLRNDEEPRFASLPFAHPLYILYSSGTTGRPKCIVHGAGGTLLQHLKEHDDVELAGERACLRYDARALRWIADAPRARGAVAHGRGRGRDRVRHQREISRIAGESGLPASAGIRAGQTAHRALHRIAARAGRLRLRVSRCESRRASRLDLGRNGHRVLLRTRQPAAAGVSGRAAMRRARHGRGHL
jgi:acetoacetyl-CoA synthase